TSIPNQIDEGVYIGYNAINITDDKGICPKIPPTDDCHQFCYGFNPDLTLTYLNVPCGTQANCELVWQSLVTEDISFPGCNGPCYIHVHYKKAVNTCQPETYRDIELESIDRVNGCDNCNPPIDMQALYKFAEQRVLINEGRDFYIDDCFDHFRVYESKCWHASEYNTPDQWLPCPQLEPGCCWKRYKVCHKPNNIVDIDLVESCGQDITCPTITAPNICMSVCGTNAEGQGWRIAIPENETNILNDNVNSYVVPNPSDDFCELHVLSQEKGVIHLMIYGILGNIVYSKSMVKNENELIFKVDNNQIPVGFYHYNIMANNRLLINGYFNILR
ncbi:MAG: hypothetical protein Q8M94_13610, partial [Ignavibacteria bacterium]|nr:hypothetical protein [Ignavibacteria bacterium]